MAVNPLYIVAPNLQEYFVNKLDGTPLAGGKIFTYISGTKTPKLTYTISGAGPNYTYTPLPNPIILSGVGTVQDNNYNDVLIYWYPFDAEENQQLYDIYVQDQYGNPQFSRVAWPNPSANNIVGLNEDLNYIPNGQLLIHSNVEPNSVLGANTTVIAAGGFEMVLPATIHSQNTLTFQALEPTDVPNQSPKYLATLAVVPGSPLDTSKILRIKFYDVNKFSSAPSQAYTFGVWLQSTVNVTIPINVHKYFGTSGSMSEDLPQPSITSTPSGFLFNVSIDFGTNDGTTVDLINQNDFVSIDLLLPVNIPYSLSFSDFSLLAGNVAITGFPIETNADMMTRSVYGWTDIPNPDGSDLYLKPMLTQYGMTWDKSDIGKVYAAVYATPQFNELLCDGTSYLTAGYSSLGIPYSRLWNVVWNNAVGMPQFGTGYQFINTYVSAGSASTLIACTNSPGAQTATIDGSTGFTFSNGIIGSNVYGLNALPGGNDTVWVSTNASGTPTSIISAGTSGFTVSTYQPGSAAINQVTTIVINSAPTVGTYFYLSNAAIKQYFWFKVNGAGSDPTPAPGGTGYAINILSSFTNTDVQLVVAAALSGFQVSYITTVGGASIAANAYYKIYANSLQYVVWYSLNGAGTQPVVASTQAFIPVSYTSVQADTVVATNTQVASNTLYYGVPDFRETFFRSWSATGGSDSDRDTRYSVNGLNVGNLIGTGEYGQLASHNHAEYFVGTPPGSIAAGTAFSQPQSVVTGNTGGAENRPNNSSLNFIIKY